MLERGKNERGVIEMVDTESLVPTEHLSASGCGGGF